MHLLEQFDQESWNAFIDELDCRILAGVERYLEACDVLCDDVAVGYSELGRMKDREDPNYDLIGTPIAYAYKYLPRRAAVLAGVLNEMPTEIRGSIRTVLDVGSGPDLAYFVFDLMWPDQNVKFRSLEPSQALQKFGSCLLPDANSRIVRIRSFIEEISNTPVMDGQGKADIIFLSAALPYRWWFRYEADHWDEVSSHILHQASKDARVILIEPQLKAGMLNRLGAAFERRGWREEWTASCHDLLPELQKEVNLERLTRSLKLNYQCLTGSTKLNERGRSVLAGGHRNQARDVTSWNTNKKYSESIKVYRM